MPPDPPTAEPASKPTAARYAWLVLAGLLTLAAILAITSLLGDSPTFDEPLHLTAGIATWHTGDFRLSPDHPPLARLWCTLPTLLLHHTWLPADHPAWIAADMIQCARDFLFDSPGNDPRKLVLASRSMMVALLLATVLATYQLGCLLIGRTAGLLAAGLATLSPTLLAHGRLVTTDLPLALLTALTLLAAALLGRKITWWRLGGLAAALAALALTKMNWPLVLPALAAMALVVVIRQRPWPAVVRRQAGQMRVASAIAPRTTRLGYVVGCGVAVALVMWIAIWTAYGFQRYMLPDPTETEPVPGFARTQQVLGLQWYQVVREHDGALKPGLVPRMLDATLSAGILPEAYIFGFGRAWLQSQSRDAYLMGAYSDRGWPSYFPIAFAIKTPLPMLALVAAGIVALVRFRHVADPTLLVGIVTFIVVYMAVAITSSINIGHRHLLPLYPLLFVLAGGAASWLTSRVGRVALGAAFAWLFIVNLCVHPHYLSFFNAAIGGPARGHLYLADSNLDWGQDLLRLADYARHHPDERIWLSYFGSSDPTHYVDCAPLPSFPTFGQTPHLESGTFVISITNLLGVYPDFRRARPGTWTAAARAEYAAALKAARRPPATNEPAAMEEWLSLQQRLPEIRALRLISRLRQRPPDTRIGYSLFVYRLDAGQLTELTAP